MGRRKQYEVAQPDNTGRTHRHNNNERYTPYTHDSGIRHNMAYDNYMYDMRGDCVDEDPYLNKMPYYQGFPRAPANRPRPPMEPNNPPPNRCNDEHNHGSKHHHNREDVGRRSQRHKKKRKSNVIILSAVALTILLVVVATPLLIIYVFGTGSPITEGRITMELKLSDEFQNGMEDPSSTVFNSTATELCTEIELAFTTDRNSAQTTHYVCRITSLSQGSVIVTFVLSVTGSYDIPDNNIYVQTITTYIGTTRTLGSYTVISGSIVVISASYTQQGDTTIVTSSVTVPTTTTIPPEIQLDSSIISPHGDIFVACNVQHAPNSWKAIRIISPDITTGIVAVAYANGTTQKDSNSYQLAFQQSSSNVSMSLWFPNTTRHCFGRRNYTCALYEYNNIFVETTHYISIPVVDIADNIDVIVNTTINEGDTYVVNCTGDLAPPSSTLDLFMRTANETSFTKSSVNPIVTTDGVTESCYLQTTKSYSFLANRNDNGTQVKCEGLNTTTGIPSVTETKPITIRIAEIEMSDSTTTPEEELPITCRVRYAPSRWDNFSIVSSDNIDIHVTAFSNGTIVQGNNSYTARFQQRNPDIILSVLFPNTTTHCYARGSYVCTLTDNGNIVINTTATVIIADVARSLMLEGNSTVNEGDRYEMNCSGKLATEGGDLHLHVRPVNSSVFVMATEVPIVTVGEFNDLCYQSITKTYNFLADKSHNGTEFVCMATNDKLSSSQQSSSIDMLVDFADFNAQFHLRNTTWIPAFGDNDSVEFKDFAAKIERDTDYVYGKSAIKDNYKKSKVTELMPGSVNVVIVMFIEIELIIVGSSNDVITTKLTPTDIISSFHDTLPQVANEIPDSELLNVEENDIDGDVITDPGEGYECSETKTDVVFLLDASGSIGSINFNLTLFFIKNITANILLGPDAIQVSVVTFSTKPRHEFWLNEHYGALTLTPAIEAIVYTGRLTYIAKGLQYVRDNAFSDANGARADSEKVIILMTDGKSSDNSASIASTLRNEGVLVACVGIGSGINVTQLTEIAYNSSYIFYAENFDVLTQIRDTVRNSACNAVSNNND